MRPAGSFNPRPLARANRLEPRPNAGRHLVSIHALLRGRTYSYRLARGRKLVSIHALLRGRTPANTCRNRCFCFNPRPLARANRSPRRLAHHARVCFNPRPLARANEHSQNYIGCQLVSIHALLRGRTDYICVITKKEGFQSTPSCEGELIIGELQTMSTGFNPRPLARANRKKLALASAGLRVSIHALLRGRTSRRS